MGYSGIGVLGFLRPHFRQTTSMFRTTVPGIWDLNWIYQTHPDIVILEFAERFLNDGLVLPGEKQAPPASP